MGRVGGQQSRCAAHLGVVRMGSACPVILIPAPRSCPCVERRGFKGKEHAGHRRARGGGAASGLAEREEGVSRKEQRAQRISVAVRDGGDAGVWTCASVQMSRR